MTGQKRTFVLGVIPAGAQPWKDGVDRIPDCCFTYQADFRASW